MALNGTQKNLIEGLLKTYLDDILMINLDDAIRALNAVFQENISAEDETFFKEKNIWEDVQFIHRILSHPCPQNRMINYPYFGPPSDPEQIVYKDAEGKAAFEQKGLLGLTAKNDLNTPSVTKEDVTRFIKELIDSAVEKKKTTTEREYSSQPEFFKEETNYSQTINEIKRLLTADELQEIPIMALVRLPTSSRLSFCQLVRKWRYEPELDDYFYNPVNNFLDGLSTLIQRGVCIDTFLSFNAEKQELLATEMLTLHLIDVSIDFNDFSQLEVDDIKTIFAWISSDGIRALKLIEKLEAEDLVQEITSFIDDKLNSLRINL